MADLTWFPYDVGEWDRRVREMGLSLVDESALMRLIRGSWSADEPCTIRDDPDELARIVGVQWRKALPVLRANFAPLPDHPKLLRCGWLYDMYLKALEKHLSYSTRGGKGGKAKAEKGSSARSLAKAQLEAELEPNQKLSRAKSTTEAFSCALTEHTTKSPATNGALAHEARAPVATTDDTHREAESRNGLRHGEPRSALPRPVSFREVLAEFAPDLVADNV